MIQRWSRSRLGGRLAALLAAALALIGVVALPAAPAFAAANVQVFVGYADNLRANPANFPTPWDGSPSVDFAGCTPNCTFDAGAVRLVNNAPIAVTVDSVIVKVSTCTWDIWPHGTVLQPGEQLIVTQTTTVAAATCGGTSGAFDTSDVGVNGAGTTCTPDGVIPEIDTTIDGVASAFQDTGQVLNTGGVDRAACAGGPNESQQWSSVGTQSCPGSVLSLAPATQTDAVGSSASVTAHLANSCGTALQGAKIDFAVQNGPNAGKTGSGTTDQNGDAVFSYTGAATGTDTDVASTTNPAGTITSNTVSVVWQKRTSSLSITGGAATGDYNDPASVAATLTDELGPVAGQTVTFTLNGAETCSAVTNGSGVASCPITPQEAAGPYPLTASFAGSATDLGSTATATFTVTHEETTTTYTGPAKAANGAPLTLSGVLKEDGTAPISGRTLTFTLGSGGSAQSCSGTTDATGSASCTIASVNQPAATTTVPVTAAFAGDAYYQPSSATATLKFQYLTGRAFGLSSSGLVGISPVPDTGPIATAAAGTFGPPCVVRISGLIAADTLCAKVVTSLNPGTSAASASVQDATIGVIGVPVIKVGLVQTSSTTTCAGSSGDATVTSLSVGGIPVNVNLHPGANTTVNVLGVTIILNEQSAVPGADQGLTVNAVHIKVLGLLDVVLASSTSDIHNCN
ncbi:MAG TPA: Ig-like domain-containing protein [Actinocrinis sp.]|uniref:Ig-like domain-containing protein n=1 Tax=Actinocrinis sp. TaxID=1920516 RepID=UPI002D5665E0|nr:Ig-like domain-containing protein [Actinocrinis sp.]HZU58716.1 Ig-like domain-containing protein [Actinocrinis sp.]